MKPRASDTIHTYGARARRTAPPGGDTSAHGARSPRRRLVLGVLVLAAVVSTRWVRLNIAPSVPYGLYWLRAVPPTVPRQALVVLPVPAVMRPWHSRWISLLKPVAAVAGDEVCGNPDAGLTIAGEAYGPLLREAHGLRLPTMAWCLTVEEGEVFLASKAPRSLDSRYFGLVPITGLTAMAVPLLTWR